MVSEWREREERRLRRYMRVRKKWKRDIPRVIVLRTNKNFHAQVILDGKCVLAVSTCDKDIREKILKEEGKLRTWGFLAVRLTAEKLARLMKGKGIEKSMFDRRYYRYHGKVKYFAECLREFGIKL